MSFVILRASVVKSPLPDSGILSLRERGGGNGVVSPLRKQYLHIKQQYPDVILFFHLGDFYETFDEDAITLNRVLEVTLTAGTWARANASRWRACPSMRQSRTSRGSSRRAIASRSASRWRSRRPRAGGRKVTRVVTPGTVVEPGMLDAGTNNYLVACVADERSGRCGIAYADITTGEFACAELEDIDTLGRELLRIQPAEASCRSNTAKASRRHRARRGCRKRRS